MSDNWTVIPRILERMHRLFLDLLQTEMTSMGIQDLAAVQMFLLLDIGEDEISLKDLLMRGHYQRSAVLNQVRKLAESGHIEQSRAGHDRRAVRLKLTPEVSKICSQVRQRLAQVEETYGSHLQGDDIAQALRTLRRIERSWEDTIREHGV